MELRTEYEGTAKRILVVDDDIDLLMLLERCLLKEGYDVDTAASLFEAEEILPYFSPHLLLVDINVHGEDGRQLCWKWKKQQEKDVKIIIMSGYDYDVGRAVLFGADDLVTKPLYVEYLLLRIKSLLNEETTPFVPAVIIESENRQE
ncbi:MAG TPA: response regulator [Chitinophagaceae bacterium]|nr:response regulator [Chitinophagaceae bacterium]